MFLISKRGDGFGCSFFTLSAHQFRQLSVFIQHPLPLFVDNHLHHPFVAHHLYQPVAQRLLRLTRYLRSYSSIIAFLFGKVTAAAHFKSLAYMSRAGRTASSPRLFSFFAFVIRCF